MNVPSRRPSEASVAGLRASAALAAALALAALALAAPASAAWKHQAIDTSGRHMGKTSLALDGDGKIHLLAYHSGQYEHRYWRQDGNSLVRRPLIFTNGYADLAFDGDGKLHAVLVAGVRAKNNPKDLLHLELRPDTSIATLIDTTAAHYHWLPDLAVDREGKLHVTAYLQEYPQDDPPRANYEARDLAYAGLGDGGKWNWANLDSSADEVSKHSALAFDKDNRAHIAYLNVSKGNLLYKRQTDSGWHSGEITNAAGDKFYGFFVQMLMDDDGKPHVVFMRYGAGDKLYLHHAYPDTGSAWTVDSLDAGDTYSDNSAIGFVKVGDGFAVAYRDAAKHLSLARIDKDNKAALEKIDTTANTGFAASLAVDGDGDLYVTYLDGDGFVRLATENADFTLPVRPGKSKAKPGMGSKLRRQGSLLRLDLLMPAPGRVEAEFKDAAGRTLGVALPARELGKGSHSLVLSRAKAPSHGRYWLWIKRDGQTGDVLEVAPTLP